eukprot:scaffold4720_cov106-Isochrysis_galbana.AAC.3
MSRTAPLTPAPEDETRRRHVAGGASVPPQPRIRSICHPLHSASTAAPETGMEPSLPACPAWPNSSRRPSANARRPAFAPPVLEGAIVISF